MGDPNDLASRVADGRERLAKVEAENKLLRDTAEAIIDSQYADGPIDWDTFNWLDLFERLEVRTRINLDRSPSRVRDIKAHVRRLWDAEAEAWLKQMHDGLAETLAAAMPKAETEARLAAIKASVWRLDGLTKFQIEEVEGLLGVANDEAERILWGRLAYSRQGVELEVIDPGEAVDDLRRRAVYLEEEGTAAGQNGEPGARSLRSLADRIESAQGNADIDDLIERSSLGSPGAKALRARTHESSIAAMRALQHDSNVDICNIVGCEVCRDKG